MTRRIFFATVALIVPLCAQSNPFIRGRILDDVSHRSVPHARLSLAGGNLKTPVAVLSDDQGTFQFSGVDAGRYRLSIEKAGFFSETPYGQIDVVSGSPTVVPDIVLTVKRTISGTIRFRDGLPAYRGDVRLTSVKGGKAGSGINGAQANDRGEFVFSNLRPGRYVLSASSSGGTSQPRDSFGEAIPIVAGRTAVPTYYPGTETPDVRSSIDVRSVAEASRLLLTLDEKPGGVDVEGTVANSSAAPPGSPVIVALLFANNPQNPIRQVQAAPGGGFKLTSVPSGRYLLASVLQIRAGTGTSAIVSTMPLDVGPQPVRGVSLPVGEPAPIKGQIEIQGTAAGSPPAPFRIQALPQNGLPVNVQTTADAKGEFQMNGTSGEVYDLSLLPTPTNMYLDRVTQGDRDLGAGIGVRAGGDPVRIVLKQDGGIVEGRVRVSDRPASKAFVVLAPADRTKLHLYRTATADAQGVFKITSVAPGSYNVLALDRNEDDDYLDDATWRNWQSSAVAVKVDAASTQSAELQVVRIR